jgi:hypothetical protein
MKNDINKAELSNDIKIKVAELNKLIDIANSQLLSVMIIPSQKTVGDFTLHSNIGVKVYETKLY